MLCWPSTASSSTPASWGGNTASPAAGTIPSATTGPPAAAATAGPVTFPAVSTAGSPAPHSLGVVSIAAFGPDGTADGDNPALASQIFDVSTDQPWYSQWYATPEFGDLRSGTGLLLDMGETVTVRDVRLALGSEPGADVQVRAGSSPSVGLPVVASASGVGGDVRLTATAPARGRYVLIWFTRLPSDGHGHYQISVYSVFVDG
jgi:hypothetical protein